MTPRLRRCDQVEPQRWRNGAGFTRELLTWPDASGWALRISVADIDADAPFSAFPGVERWFAVVEGAGVALQMPEGRKVVDGSSAPLHFAGEAAPACALIDGPTRDLNLMVRRGSGRATMRRANAGEGFAPPQGLSALFVAEAATLQIDGADALQLPPFALAWSDAARGIWRLAGSAAKPRAWWIGFETVGVA